MLAAWILVGIRGRSLARLGGRLGGASAGGMAESLVHDCDGVGWGRSQGRLATGCSGQLPHRESSGCEKWCRGTIVDRGDLVVCLWCWCC